MRLETKPYFIIEAQKKKFDMYFFFKSKLPSVTRPFFKNQEASW